MKAIVTSLDDRIAFHATKFVELEARRMTLRAARQKQAAERHSALAELQVIERRLDELRKVLQ